MANVSKMHFIYTFISPFLHYHYQNSDYFFSKQYFTGTQDNIGGIVTRLLAGRSGVKILARARDLPLLQNIQTSFGALPASYSRVQGFFPMGKAVRA
jgi:hypothetical protein